MAKKRQKMWSDRDDSPAYKKWRKEVFKRDKYRCRYPSCKLKGGLNAHHIYRYADYPLLRYSVSNGITLCYKHHKITFNKEESFAPLFVSIINPESQMKIWEALYKKDSNDNSEG